MGLRPEQLKLPTEHLILNLEGVIVNLDYDSAVAQAKPTRSRFDPLEGGLFGAFLERHSESAIRISKATHATRVTPKS
jgi:hypothetical protein